MGCCGDSESLLARYQSKPQTIERYCGGHTPDQSCVVTPFPFAKTDNEQLPEAYAAQRKTQLAGRIFQRNRDASYEYSFSSKSSKIQCWHSFCRSSSDSAASSAAAFSLLARCFVSLYCSTGTHPSDPIPTTSLQACSCSSASICAVLRRRHSLISSSEKVIGQEGLTPLPVLPSGVAISDQFFVKSIRSALRVTLSPSQGELAWSKSLRLNVLKS
jgi:hypothetical protein